jgi:hypothetical protein
VEAGIGRWKAEIGRCEGGDRPMGSGDRPMGNGLAADVGRAWGIGRWRKEKKGVQVGCWLTSLFSLSFSFPFQTNSILFEFK